MRLGTAGIGLIVLSLTLSPSLRDTPTDATSQPEPLQGADSARVVIAEVLFAPAAGDTSSRKLS